MVAFAGPRTAAAELAQFCTMLDWDRLDTLVRGRTRELVLDLVGVTLAGSRQPSSAAAYRAALAARRRRSGKSDRRAHPCWGAGGLGRAGQRHRRARRRARRRHDRVVAPPGVAVIPAALAIAEELRLVAAGVLRSDRRGLRGHHARRQRAQPRLGLCPRLSSDRVCWRVRRDDGGGPLARPGAAGLTQALGIAGTMAAARSNICRTAPGPSGSTPAGPATPGSAPRNARTGRVHWAGERFRGPTRRPARYTDAPNRRAAARRSWANRAAGDARLDQALRLLSLQPRADRLRTAARGATTIAPGDVARISSGCSAAARCWWPSRSSRSATPRTSSTRSSARRTPRAAALVFGTGGIDAYTAERIDGSDACATSWRAPTAIATLARRRLPAPVARGGRDPAQRGRRLATRVHFATGEPENPVPRAALVDKFVSLATGSVPNPPAVAELILNLEQGVGGMETLSTMLRRT